jgi:hypothetical protein
MKKTAVLLAGLLLVTGTVFAEGWEVTGADVSGTLNIVDTQSGMDMEDGDAYLGLEMVKEGDFGTLTFTAEFDKDGDTGEAVDIAYSKTEGDFSVGLGAAIDFSGDDTSSSVGLTTDANSDTYLAWQVMGSEDMKLTVYPFEVDGMSWDEDTWESFTGNGGEGFALAVTLAEDTTVTAKWAMDEQSTDTNANAFKFELSTKVSDISIDAYLGMRPEVDAEISSTNDVTSMTAMGAKASMTMDSLTLNGEFNTQTEDEGDALVGIYAKASLAMDEINGYATTAYASFTSLNEYVDTAAGATTEIEAGVTLAQGSFSVTPKIVLETAENDVYGEEETGANATDSATTIGVEFAYSM